MSCILRCLCLIVTAVLIAFAVQAEQTIVAVFGNKSTTSPFPFQISRRPNDAVTGAEFAEITRDMLASERQRRALVELRQGNLPGFMRKLKPVGFNYITPEGATLTAIIWVMPDYLAIGSDKDFLRIPLNYSTAIEIADDLGFILPTPRMVDIIYEQATCQLKPQTMKPGPRMRSIEYYWQHQQDIKAQRNKEGCALGELTAGHKKDIVLTNLLNKRPGRIAIYGWQKPDGVPIQPLSTFHGAEYADYSHGVRLVYQTMWINDKAYNIRDVLKNPLLAPVLSDEGIITHLDRMLTVQRR
ncbi:MAG: hypothetical protein HQM11_15845 [SAR324 cluster bacterium]|nr:hypothetical protein [SAR324 cluster bacterium]